MHQKKKGSCKKPKEPKIPEIKKPHVVLETYDFRLNTAKSIIKFILEQEGDWTLILVPKHTIDRVRNLIKNGYEPAMLQLSYQPGELKVSIVLKKVAIKQRNPTKIMGIDINTWGITYTIVDISDNKSVKIESIGTLKTKHIRRIMNILEKIDSLMEKASRQVEEKFGLPIWYWSPWIHKVRKRYFNRINNIGKDKAHFLSKKIVQIAAEHKVDLIVLEELEGLLEEKSFKGKMRKVVFMGYGKLAEYITYKAKEKGINVKKVNPAFSSQVDPLTKKKVEFIDERKRWAITSRGIINRDVLASLNIVLRGVGGSDPPRLVASQGPRIFQTGEPRLEVNKND